MSDAASFETMPLEELDALVTAWNTSYHDDDISLVSDAMYDATFRLLNKRLKDAGLPEKMFVGAAGTKGFKKVTHAVKCYSLENAFTLDDIMKFIKAAKASGCRVVTEEPKIDGLSLTLTYIDGALVLGATRGDGSVGEDVTENVRRMKNVPLTIPAGGTVHVRGEAYMCQADLDRYNENLSKGKKPLKNLRNAAAGTLRQHNADEVSKRGLSFLAYDIISDDTAGQTHLDNFYSLTSMGFEATSISVLELNEKESTLKKWVQDIYDHHEKIRSARGYDVDGIVLKVNEPNIRKEMGATSRVPSWAIAWKFNAQQVPTKITSLDFQVGRTGTVTPVANLEPVAVGGVIVSRATLHGYKNYLDNPPAIGADVVIQRAGDVIPQIVSIENGDNTPHPFPEHCPSCGSHLVLDGANMFCVSDHCPDRDKAMLSYVVSRDVLNVVNVGEKNVQEMYDAGLIADAADLFNLVDNDKTATLHDFRLLYPSRAGTIILSGVKKAREAVEMWRFIAALGISKMSESHPRKLAEAVGTPQKLWEMVDAGHDFTDILGPARNGFLTDWFKVKHNRDYYQKLSKVLDVTPVTVQEKVLDSVWSGLKIVFTGSSGGVDRKELEAIARRFGATPSSSISRKVDLVVYGEGAGQKLTKAQDLGVRTLPVEEWLSQTGNR